MSTPVLTIGAVLGASLLLALGAGEASAQYASPLGGNPVLRDPGAYTPQPRRAGPPPQTYRPAQVLPPSTRLNNAYPDCIAEPCTRTPVIVRP